MASRVWKGYLGAPVNFCLISFLIPGDGHLCYLISDWKEWIRVFCCPKVETVSLQESLDGTFWCHEFLRPMEKRNNEKNNDIRPFSCMLDRLKHIVCFHFNEWINQNKANHFCYCSAWSRLKLNTKIGLNHHPPPTHPPPTTTNF